jgi:plastocyanin
MGAASATRSLAVAACVLAPALLSGCRLTSETTDTFNGKKLFVAKCGSCHTLARAGTTGIAGPNLDQAFQRSRREGLGQTTFQGIVEHQIKYPPRRVEMDPVSHKPLTLMPANLVTGSDAADVAAYVAFAAGRPGKDTGALASAGVKKAQGTAQEKSGTLAIPVAQTGLAFQFANAQAKAGRVVVAAKNSQPTDHNIAIKGNGVAQKGSIVSNGGTSKVTVTLKPGTYTFYCSVDGHELAGMRGKLTVK